MHTSLFSRCRWAALTAFLAAFSIPGAPAQDVRGEDQWGIPKMPQRVAPGIRPDAVQPPAGLIYRESKNETLAVPAGPFVPEPNTPESHDVAPAQQAPDTGQFRYFQNQVINPTGFTTSSRTPEPANGILQDTVLQTSNWYAAISPDNGETWNPISPYTFFPSASAGFCCDQQCINVPAHNMVIWLLQYSANSAGNTYRFAVAKGRDNLRSGDPSDWYYYDFDAQDFGFATGAWLDYPDIAYDGTWLHCSANVFGGASGSVRWRMELADLANNTGLSWTYSTNATLLSGSYRFAKGISGGKMIWAAHNTTSSVYVYEMAENSNSWFRASRAVGSWTSGTGVCPDPNGTDWCGRAVGGIRGAFGNSSQVGFMWTARQNGSRPYPYVRIARFRVSDRTLIGEQDIWNSNYAYAYADGNSNSLGHIGIVTAVGGGTLYPHVSGTVFDQFQAFGGSVTTYASASGNSGPNANRFGDYFTVRRHPLSTNTFIGNGSNQNGGTAHSQAQHRFLWFGRDDYEPTWVTLNVTSTPITGVSITQDVRDLSGNKNGSTNYTRRFAPQQGYELTAPATVTVGRVVYAFERWALQVQPGASFGLRTIGELTLSTSNVGNLDDVAEARYKVRRTLNIQSTNPSSGVAITLSAPDINGNQNGSTSFTRYFRDGEAVTLTAPASVGFNPFKQWRLNGVLQPLGTRTLNVNMTATRTAIADYYVNVAGSVVQLGAGCVGSNGLVPLHTITWPAGQQGPQQGTTSTYRLANARPSAGGVLHLGVDKTMWGAFVLPLNLQLIGMNGCFLFHDLIVSPGITTNAVGQNAFPIVWPVSPAAIGTHIYSTYAIIDIGAPRPTPVTHSNAMDLRQGGNQ